MVQLKLELDLDVELLAKSGGIVLRNLALDSVQFAMLEKLGVFGAKEKFIKSLLPAQRCILLSRIWLFEDLKITKVSGVGIDLKPDGQNYEVRLHPKSYMEED